MLISNLEKKYMNKSQVVLSLIFLINIVITLYILIDRIFYDPHLYFIEIVQTIITSLLLLYMIIEENEK